MRADDEGPGGRRQRDVMTDVARTVRYEPAVRGVGASRIAELASSSRHESWAPAVAVAARDRIGRSCSPKSTVWNAFWLRHESSMIQRSNVVTTRWERCTAVGSRGRRAVSRADRNRSLAIGGAEESAQRPTPRASP